MNLERELLGINHSAVGGSSSSDGWQGGKTEGTTTKNGITLTVRSAMKGTALGSTDNLNVQTTGSTQGFVFSDINKTDDGNSGSLKDYQRIDFIFNTPVALSNFTLADIDTSSSSITNFNDAIAVEGFGSSTPGALGTGLKANYNIVQNELYQKNIGNLAYVSRNTVSNVDSIDPKGQAGISFNQGVKSASVYLFNDVASSDKPDGSHSVNIFNSAIQVEPVPFEFSPTLGLLLSGGSLLGLNFLKKSRKLPTSAKAK